jgi:hypothetical protein
MALEQIGWSFQGKLFSPVQGTIEKVGFGIGNR